MKRCILIGIVIAMSGVWATLGSVALGALASDPTVPGSVAAAGMVAVLVGAGVIYWGTRRA